jgi:Rieske Fe-S protein
VQALSAVCPHLGCAVDFDTQAGVFKCPCHKSAFGLDGAKISGPSKRGLDPLPVRVDDGRVKVTFIRFRSDIAEREPA